MAPTTQVLWYLRNEDEVWAPEVDFITITATDTNLTSTYTISMGLYSDIDSVIERGPKAWKELRKRTPKTEEQGLFRKIWKKYFV